ncbi:Undecaprenyl-phosphate alpha-N-acetylglucosaminyl 1-phosphate transferase [compost metagenome]
MELSQPVYNYGKHVPPVVMLWVTGILLMDLLSVTIRRALAGRNPLSADRTHLHHMLARLDIHPAGVVWIIIGSNAALGAVGVLAWRYGMTESALFLSFLLVVAVHVTVMQYSRYFLRRARRWFGRNR